MGRIRVEGEPPNQTGGDENMFQRISEAKDRLLLIVEN